MKVLKVAPALAPDAWNDQDTPSLPDLGCRGGA